MNMIAQLRGAGWCSDLCRTVDSLRMWPAQTGGKVEMSSTSSGFSNRELWHATRRRTGAVKLKGVTVVQKDEQLDNLDQESMKVWEADSSERTVMGRWRVPKMAARLRQG